MQDVQYCDTLAIEAGAGFKDSDRLGSVMYHIACAVVRVDPK